MDSSFRSRATGDSADVSFLDVSGLAVDRRGRVLVADYTRTTIAVLSPTGRHLFDVGRQGRGPTEFLRPCCISVGSDGRMWVEDSPNHRYVVFDLGDKSSEVSLTVRMPSQASGHLDRVAWDSLGRIAHISVTADPETGRFHFTRAWVDSLGVSGPVERLHDPPADSVGFVALRGVRGGITGVDQPFGPRPLQAFGPGGDVAFAVSSRYAVSWTDATGRVRLTLGRQRTGPPVSERERKEAEEQLRALTVRLGLRRGAIPFDVPRTKAPIESLGFDLDGRLWVALSLSDGATQRSADVYDRNGAFLAQAAWPARVSLRGMWAVTGDTAYGVVTRYDGGQEVVRMLFEGLTSASPKHTFQE